MEDGEQLRRLASKFVIQMKQAGVSLTYDRNGVLQLAEMIDRERKTYSEEERESWTSIYGAFLGECMIQVFGGRWQLSEERGVWGVALNGFPAIVFPLERVGKHLVGGRGSSILSFFDQIAEKVRENSSGNRVLRFLGALFSRFR